MLTPIALMKALLPAMIQQGWGRVVNITEKSVKAPVSVLGLLTGYVAGTSRQVANSGVTINNLQPAMHHTDRGLCVFMLATCRVYCGAEYLAGWRRSECDDVAAQICVICGCGDCKRGCLCLGLHKRWHKGFQNGT